MNKKFHLYLIVLISLLGFLLSIPEVTSPVYAQDNGQNHEILFSIPVGDAGVHYSGIEHPDMLTWGPAAITVAPDGSFWIADTAGNQLLQYDAKGKLLNAINIEDSVIGAGDIAVTSKEIWLLDEASQPPKVVHMALDGKILNDYELPEGLHLDDGLSGIDLGEGDQILVEREGGSKLTRFITSDGKVDPRPLEGYVYDGKVYMARPADLRLENTANGLITAGGIHIDVAVANDLGGLRILGRHTDGSFFVIVEEIVVDTALHVDQTVRHYSLSGELLGLARVPLAEQYTTVSHGLVVGSNGEVYVLITKPDRVEVQRLRFSKKLDPILSTLPVMSTRDSVVSIEYSPLACRSRDTMINTAFGYLSNLKYLNNTNINGACSNRTKPHYLTIPGNYNSVSYDWGGFDTVSAWNNYMTNNYQAGDIDTTGGDAGEGCSRGVDCSGYVSRVWGLASKYGTCGLETISTQLSGTSQLLRGDIMNRCSPTPRHTIVFDSFGINGMYGYESTTYNNYDKVMGTFRLWSDISNYVPRRYNNVCP